ncbi:guanylate kinase [Suipraeoptans intestinalis]|uniref:guanylate kinase n=1 Tax=Suipraeoptans intestinalis TaxID=2606628 RepID=UPI0023F38064|nr:guanylate kinase [Suipraeoptans intestinalis]MDD7770656.1 guanylate kinase [Suipraeoptans intestinalis]MDY3122043.1 guanylate kinase [Suipraeoptans intestinalis]
MMRRGILTVVSGFSGAGKGTMMKRLLEKYDSYALSVSATTRLPREGEQEGREYFFKTTEAFLEMIENEELVEYARYVDNFYGTPKAYVEQQLADGKDVILEIEIQGARKIKEKIPDAVLLFIAPPSMQELKRRLLGRGTETEEIIQARLERAQKESVGMEDYDYLIINDDLDVCVEDVHHIIRGEHRRTERNKEFIKQIQGELKGE